MISEERLNYLDNVISDWEDDESVSFRIYEVAMELLNTVYELQYEIEKQEVMRRVLREFED